jgi:hypothetical protein
MSDVMSEDSDQDLTTQIVITLNLVVGRLTKKQLSKFSG